MSERLVRELFPNIPGPEHTKKLRLTSDALKYIELCGSNEEAIQTLKNKCRMCSVDDCHCSYPEIIEVIQKM